MPTKRKKLIPTVNSQLVDIQIDEKFEKFKLKKQKRFNKLRNKALKFMKKYYDGDNNVMLVITSNDAGLYFRELRCDTDENAVESTKNGGAEDVE
jgi:hypothetical protein